MFKNIKNLKKKIFEVAINIELYISIYYKCLQDNVYKSLTS